MLRSWGRWGIAASLFKENLNERETLVFMGWSLNKHDMTLCSVLKFNMVE
jgi:hypothetical protein